MPSTLKNTHAQDGEPNCPSQMKWIPDSTLPPPPMIVSFIEVTFYVLTFEFVIVNNGYLCAEQQEAYDSDNDSIVDAEQVINESTNGNANTNYLGNPPDFSESQAPRVVGNNGMFMVIHICIQYVMYHTFGWNALNELLLIVQKLISVRNFFKLSIMMIQQ